MKKIIVSFIAGVIFATATVVYAEDGLQKVEAYLRPSLKFTLNGEDITLDNSPIMYDGATHVRLRDIAKITGLPVNWNDATQTVELGKGVTTLDTTTTTPTETTYSGLRAITLNGETYFAMFDYNRKFKPYQWGYDAATNTMFLAETEKGTTTIKRKLVDIKKDDPIAFTIYNGESFINVKHYSQQ